MIRVKERSRVHEDIEGEITSRMVIKGALRIALERII